MMRFKLKCICIGVLLSGTGLRAQQGITQPVIAVQAPAAPSSPALIAGPVPVSQAVADPSQIGSTYLLGADDSIVVTVWKEQNFSGPHSVRPDGMISMPLLGDIQAAGLTPMQLSDDISKRLKKYVNDPLVTVSVQQINSKHIYIVGQVLRVGPLALVAGMTPLQALASAGGLGPFANEKHIYILRKVSGKEEKIPFNYKTALKTGNMQGIQLAPGDTIVVP